MRTESICNENEEDKKTSQESSNNKFIDFQDYSYKQEKFKQL
jgi:hypothetical protein